MKIKRLNKSTVDLGDGLSGPRIYKLPKESRFINLHIDLKGVLRGFDVEYVSKTIQVDMKVKDGEGH